MSTFREYHFLAQRIEELCISPRAFNALKRNKINTIGEVCQRRATELMQLRGFDRMRLNDLHYALGQCGLEFVPEEDLDSQNQVRRLLTSSRARLMSVQDLGLSAKTYDEVMLNAQTKIETVRDILDWYSKRSVRENFPSECAGELIEKLKQFDFYLR